MSALTMTLLPEPVAPAMSRCGILARSTAWALPATSRPSANVSVEPDALKSTSSRIRRRATMLKSAFGISMPTALLPGIGASMRRERAARAIARSSARPSIRLTLMSGAGWTSYWVTTGPALRPTTLAGIPKLASLRTMISSTCGVGRRVAAGVDRDGDVVEQGRRRERVLDAVARRRRVAGVGHVVGIAIGAERIGDDGDGRGGTRPEPAVRAGANVAEVGTALGTATGMALRAASSSWPQMPVWPGEPAGGDGGALGGRAGGRRPSPAVRAGRGGWRRAPAGRA